MSDMFTHWAVFEDCRRLMKRDAAIAPEFATAAETEQEAARLGALTRNGTIWMQPLLKMARDRWDDPEVHPAMDRRLAFVVGGITHQACDTVVKPLLTRHGGTEWNLTHAVLQREAVARGREHEVDTDRMQEISAYYDMHAFRKVYLDDEESPFTRFILSAETSLPKEAMDDFIGSSFQQALLASHTIVPPSTADAEALGEWQDRLFEFMQPLYLQPKWWRDALNKPDPVKQAEYEVETLFYDQHDPLIRAARSLQRGEVLSEAQFSEAATTGANQSIYGQALELSLRYLRAGTEFWNGKADKLVAPNEYIPSWQKSWNMKEGRKEESV